jgi:hypothetical protein
MTVTSREVFMQGQAGPRPGTKLATVNELLRRPGGATLKQINAATRQNAWSYKTNGTYLAKRYGGSFKSNGGAGSRRFWIE